MQWRFLCSICLGAVSNEPVVTHCGHLYCWLCLLTWLEPRTDSDEHGLRSAGAPAARFLHLHDATQTNNGHLGMLTYYGRASVHLELVNFSMEREEEDKASNMRRE